MSTVPTQPLPPVMTTDEVAAILRCSVRTVRAYVHSHQLDAIKIGRERVRHAQTAGLLALLRVIENPHDEISWFRVLQLLARIGPPKVVCAEFADD